MSRSDLERRLRPVDAACRGYVHPWLAGRSGRVVSAARITRRPTRSPRHDSSTTESSVLAPAPGQGQRLLHIQAATLLPAAFSLRFRQLSPCLSRRVALQHAAEALGRAAPDLLLQ